MTPIDREIGEYLAAADFQGLFVEALGWDHPSLGHFEVAVDDDVVTARPIAQKRGLHVVAVMSDGALPSADVQHRVDAEIARRLPERLLVFCAPSHQVWRWPQSRKSGGVKLVAHEMLGSDPPPALVQRLAGIRFTLAEEDALTLPVVKDRVRAQFNADQVTNQFYERFQERHASLQDAIEGLEHEDGARWYASVLMNRLMFIYFLQKKGFLNNDRDYLRSCLKGVREMRGQDEFYGFYRDVLIPMFHEGFGSVEHEYPDAELEELLGDIPYVNGGIFEAHEIEMSYEIDVPDIEFERVFDFFDGFRWHLDDRELGDPNAINPDVLGYIFERYINLTAGGQREEGAYYTKEDVTGYMTSVTILPKILDRVISVTGINPFVALQQRPSRYIQEAMLHGRDLGGDWIETTSEVSECHSDPLRWNELSTVDHDLELQLPGESWIETQDRREHVEHLLSLIREGRVNTVDDLVTHNLDLRTLLADLIHGLNSPKEIAQVWEQVTAITVIDPTCGSGAFLFAALDLLDEVYASLLERSRTHLRTGEEEALSFVGPLVEAADAHPNDDYYRRKHAALSNIFGLDIMREAIEIAKLRLFLSLVAKLEDRSEIEPLPDLDFNLRSGNLLVGFRDIDDARSRVATTSIDALIAVDEFVPKAERVTKARAAFLAAQRSDDPQGVIEAKESLQQVLGEVRVEADRVFATAQGVSVNPDEFEAWRNNHSPFHWMLEFPATIARGGFDVVVGNPPYVRRSDVSYSFDGYETNGLPDIYAPCVERSLDLLAPDGRLSMIIPISFQFSDRYADVRKVVLRQGSVWTSTFSRNPSALFTAGLGVRSAIVLTSPESGPAFTTATQRWTAAAREQLFPSLRYSSLTENSRELAWLPRTGDTKVASLLQEFRERRHTLRSDLDGDGACELGFKTTALYYLPVYSKVPPVYDRSLNLVEPPNDSSLTFASEDERRLALALLAGELAVLWWSSTGDDFHLTTSTLSRFPINASSVEASRDELMLLAEELEDQAHKEKNLLFTPYAGRMTGSWDLRRVRTLTRRIDRLVLETLGLGEYWPAVIRAMARFEKSTGERPGTERGLGWLEARQATLAEGQSD